jgi:hypothetical protein
VFAAVAGETAAVDKHFREYKEHQFSINKLAQWTDHASDVKESSEVRDAFAVIASCCRSLAVLSGEAMDVTEDMQTLAANFSIIQAAGSKSLAVIRASFEDSAIVKNVDSWFDAFQNLASTRREMIKRTVLSEASSAVDKLKKIVEPFTAASDKDTASMVKSNVETLCSKIEDWQNALKKCGFSENDAPEVAQCIKLKTQAQQMSVLWGMTTLKNVKMINDPEKGADLRTRLKQVIDAHCLDDKGNKRDFVPDLLFTECSDILKIKSVAAANKPPPKRARTS